MTTLPQRAMRFADRFVPVPIREGGDDDRLRDARTLVLVSFSMVIWGPPFAALTLGLGTLYLPILIIIATVGVVCVPAFMRWTGSFPWAVRLLIFFLFEVLYGSSLVTGGTISPALFWLPSLPLVAMLLLGKREALLSALFTAACFLSLLISEHLGVQFIQELEGGAFSIYWGACGTSAVLVIASVGAAFQLAKDRMKKDLEDALAGTRLVLDNVDQGLLILNAQGEMGSQSSRAVEQLVGPAQPGAPFSELLETVDADTGDWWALAWESVSDGFLPLDLSISQLPSRLQHRERTLEIRYQPVMEEEELTQVVVVINDISAELAREQAQMVQQEVLAVFQHLMRDPGGFEAFLREARSLLSRMPEMEPNETLRAIHTLKGNAGLFSVRSVAEVCHRVEDAMIQGGSEEAGVDEVLQAWCAFEDRLSELRGEENMDTLAVSNSDLALLKTAIQTGQSPHALLSLMQGWDKEALGARLHRFGEQSRTLADRMGKWGLQIEVSCGDLRADAQVMEPVWSAFAHAVRNAVDHGIEAPKERLKANKPSQGALRFVCEVRDEALCIELSDDGAGVDWEKVRAKAQGMDLPFETQADLEEALFRDGLSCKEEVNELSGRGVGLSALREAVETLEGSVRIESLPGQGTTLRLTLPISLVWQRELQGVKAA